VNKIIVVIASLFVAGSALAADLVCTIPTASVARGVELCEEARVALRVRAADWNNDVCSSYFLRLGLIEAEKRSTRRAYTGSVNSAVSGAVNDLTASWPGPTPAICGDGTLDTEFGETCDDGNLIDGDGCDSSCETEL